ncbi:short chain dehydrogenase/reductase SDR, partial [Aphelenchoides avenae]
MRDLFAAPTVSAMATLIDGADRVSPEITVDLDYQVETHDVKDNVMDLHLRAFWRSTEWGNRFFRSSVLLTGVTGFVGSHVLYKLLTTSQVRVMCLVRETTSESADSRLENALKLRGLLTKSVKELLKERVRVVSGDVALVQFGLSDEFYHFLTYDIDVVVHAAAYVNLIYPYQALHGINVLGTRNVLDFCHQNKVKPLHYISTDAVVPFGLKDVDEDFAVEKTKDSLQDGYGQSKYVAEQLVKRSQSRGLPCIIYRLGNQAASSTAGYWNEQDFTYLMLQAAITTGKTPDIDWTMELTPVDFSSKVICHLITNQFCENVSKTFHLINSDGPKWSEFMDWFRRFGYRIESVDADVWMQTIANSTDPALQHLQKLVQVMIRDESFFTNQSLFRRSNTDKLLTNLHWKYTPVDEKLARQWIQLLIERHVIPAPKVNAGNALIGKVCIVTGASEGIGEAIARILATEGGATVVLVARQEDKLKQLSSRLQATGCPDSNVLWMPCDITKRDEVDAVVGTCIERFGRIDVLVNCAGCMYYCMTKNGYTEEWRRQIDVNCHGTTNMVGAVVPHMIERKTGHILNITSDAGKR